MHKHQIVAEFKRSFGLSHSDSCRGIGVECEIPIVTEAGEAVPLSIIQTMFLFLEKRGFELEEDEKSGLLIAAKKPNLESAGKFAYQTDTITTDTGYSILEIVLAPQDNLHAIQTQLWGFFSLLTGFFESQSCLMLGYGIQPMAQPTRELLMPKERYRFFEKLSSNQIIPQSVGADSSLLNITASNQCHIEIGLEDVIPATNVLNALSGLQIALHANSPIWQGRIDPTYKANREINWDHCFPDRLKQIGIPPQFESIKNYVEYLLNFKPLLVKREEHFYQILNKNTFHDFLLNQSPTIGSSLDGKEVMIDPRPDDLAQLLPFCWFNARLMPQYGTIESRMCCQQPAKETLTSAALTLGLLENLEKAEALAKIYPVNKWRFIRKQAAQYALETVIDGENIVPLLLQLLDIAQEGLKKRNLQEEVFLAPLYQRIEQGKVPADLAIEVFENEGMAAFLQYASFKVGAFEIQPKALHAIV